MKRQIFAVVICSCVISFLQCNSNDEWEQKLRDRIQKLLDDPDISNKFPNLTVNFLIFNVTHFDYSSNNQTNGSCTTTDKATRCTEVNIFEVAETLPPTTEYLEITNSPVQTLRLPIFSNLTNLTHLKLTNNHIQYITSKLFIGLGSLSVLNLTDNNIRALTKTTFKGSPNIVSLDLSKNRILSLTFIPAALSSLRKLTTLSLSVNDIRFIRYNDLAVLMHSPLKELDISYCNLTRVEKGAFSHLSNLEVLILKVTYLSEEALANVTYNLPAIRVLDLRLLPALRAFPTEAMMNLANSTVEMLDFSITEFSIIPSTSFPYLPTLKKLRFSSSLISAIENGAFEGLPSLEVLDLSFNRLSAVPTAISGLINLLNLNLAAQKTDKFTIPDYSLSNLTSLMLLRLEKNTVKAEISANTFYGLRNLVGMTAYECDIVNIKPKAFASLTSLNFLELSYNKIFLLSNDTLYGLDNLTTLGLRYNGLMIGYNLRPFKHTKSLKRLHMQGNDIRTLRSDIFSAMTQLEYVNLTDNKIVPWTAPIFEEGSPKKLLLAKNEISHVTPAMLRDLERISYIDLSSNPFDCHDCRIEELRTFLLSKNVTFLNDKEDYSCLTPPNLYGYSIFEGDFELDYCYPPAFSLAVRIAVGFSAFAAFTVILLTLGYYFRWYFRYWWFHFRASMKRFSTSSDRSAYTYDAFVSYNSVDIRWVTQKLIPSLENRNSQIRLCLHDRDFEAGRLITENILECIDKSRKVLLVLTNSFAKSEWCLFELHVAQHRLFRDTRDELILIQVEPLRKEETSKHLRYLMKTRTLMVWPDDPEKEEAFWNNLHKILGY